MITRGYLKRSNRLYLIRFAKWLKLSFQDDWSNNHLASLIYWRITRNSIRNRH